MSDNRTTQKNLVLKHLKENEYLTSIEAFEKYRITRLSDRIFQLRNQGINIKTIMVEVNTQYGKEKIARYYLEK